MCKYHHSSESEINGDSLHITLECACNGHATVIEHDKDLDCYIISFWQRGMWPTEKMNFLRRIWYSAKFLFTGKFTTYSDCVVSQEDMDKLSRWLEEKKTPTKKEVLHG